MPDATADQGAEERDPASDLHVLGLRLQATWNDVQAAKRAVDQNAPATIAPIMQAVNMIPEVIAILQHAEFEYDLQAERIEDLESALPLQASCVGLMAELETLAPRDAETGERITSVNVLVRGVSRILDRYAALKAAQEKPSAD